MKLKQNLFLNNYKNTKFTNIIHISDIHIRLYEKQDEYKLVFDNLYSEIKKIWHENTLIVITGDILHNKIDLSPESLTLATEFLTNISNIGATIMIAGNHDLRIGDSNRLDALSPIYEIIKNKQNLLYIKNSESLLIGTNLCISLISVKDYSMPALLEKNEIDNRIKILLYHAPVDSAKNEYNFQFKNTKYKIEDFVNFDYVLLGDIHKHQFLTPTVAYAGSLIQNNFGEDEDNHGFIYWDLIDNNNTKFIKVDNPFIYKTINIHSNDYDYINDTSLENIRNKNVRLRIIKNIKNLNTLKHSLTIPELISYIKSTYNCNIIRITELTDKKLISDWTTNSIFIDSYNIDSQYSLFKEYLISKNKFNNELFELIKLHHKQLFEKINIDTYKNLDYNFKLHTLKFSNIFCFGEDNIIDFTQLNNINSLVADNYSGKSYVLEILLYGLYDIGERSTSGSDILNYHSKNCNIEIVFEKNSNIYKIIKKGIKNDERNTVRIEIEFLQFIDNHWINLIKDSRKNVSKIIKEFLPPINVFKHINLSLQFSHNYFVELTSADKMSFLNDIFNISFFKDLYELNSIKLTEVESLLKQYVDVDIHKTIKEYRTKLNELNANIENSEKQKIILLNVKTELNNRTNEIISNLLSLNKILENVNINENLENFSKQELEYLLDYNDKQIILLYNNNEKISIDVKQKNNSISLLNEKISKYSIEKINKNIEKITNLTNENTTLEHNNKILSTENTYLEKSLNIKYDKDCEYCINNPLVKESIVNTNKYNENILKISSNNELITNNDNSIKLLLKYNDEKIAYENIQKQINDLKNDLLNLLNSIEKNKLQITSLQNENDTCNNHLKYIDVIQQKEENETSLSILKTNLKENDVTLNVLNDNLIKYNTNKNLYEKYIIELEEKLYTFNELLIKNELYTAYKDLVNYKSGIPVYIIQKLLPIVESNMNNILNLISNFSIMFEYDNNKVDLIVNYNNKSIRAVLISGFEKTIISIAFKMTIIELFNLPKFLMIDEALSSFDQNNYNNMKYILDYLREKLDFIILISHQDDVKGFSDNSYGIIKNEKFSKINIE